MSFRYRRDKPLPKGLVYGITSIMFESALVPAKPPKLPGKSNAESGAGRCADRPLDSRSRGNDG